MKMLYLLLGCVRRRNGKCRMEIDSALERKTDDRKAKNGVLMPFTTPNNQLQLFAPRRKYFAPESFQSLQR